MPSRFRLADVPAFGLFDLVAGTTSGTGVARARSSAFVVWRRMLEVGFPRVPGTDRESACAVADLDQMAEGVIRLVGVRLVPVVTIERRDRLHIHGEIPAVRKGEGPGAVAAGRSRIAGADEIPGWPARRVGSSGFRFR